MVHRGGEGVPAGIFDRGLPSEILGKLREVFTSLDIFQSNGALLKFIKEECPNLGPWKYRISEANSTRARVSSLIALFAKVEHAEHGNALLIFLKYLEEKKGCDFSEIWQALSE